MECGVCVHRVCGVEGMGLYTGYVVWLELELC